MKSPPALFIERDGVLTHNTQELAEINQIRLIRTAGKALADINSISIPVILIVEQSEEQDRFLTLRQAEILEMELKRKLNRLNASYTSINIYPEPLENIKEYTKN